MSPSFVMRKRPTQDQSLLAETNAAYAALKADPAAWHEELAERELWEATLADTAEYTTRAGAGDGGS